MDYRHNALRKRIERVYIVIEDRTGRRNPRYGATAWFARTIQDDQGNATHRGGIQKNLSGEHPTSAILLTHLRALEWDADAILSGVLDREEVKSKYRI